MNIGQLIIAIKTASWKTFPLRTTASQICERICTYKVQKKGASLNIRFMRLPTNILLISL